MYTLTNTNTKTQIMDKLKVALIWEEQNGIFLAGNNKDPEIRMNKNSISMLRWRFNNYPWLNKINVLRIA